VSPRAGLDAVEKIKILPLPGIEPRPSSPWLYRPKTFPPDGVGGRISVEVDFKEQGVKFWTGFNWLRLEYVGGPL
jgi:hypothetical protein